MPRNAENYRVTKTAKTPEHHSPAQSQAYFCAVPGATQSPAPAATDAA